eukprot:1185806-Prorocentrum_minimum.AAC.4
MVPEACRLFSFDVFGRNGNCSEPDSVVDEKIGGVRVLDFALGVKGVKGCVCDQLANHVYRGHCDASKRVKSPGVKFNWGSFCQG